MPIASARLSALTTSALLLPLALMAQTPAHDPSLALQRVLPPNVAQQVLAEIALARSHSLPSAALEHRAFELEAKGTPPARIPEIIANTEQAMVSGKAALVAGGRAEAADAEIEAAGTATVHGVDGGAISSLAKSAPSGRSLVVPLTVLAALVDRGLPSEDALAKVVARLQAHASDQDLATLAAPGNDSGPQHGASGQAPGNGNRSDQPGPPASTPAGTTPSGVTPPVGPPSSLPGHGKPPFPGNPGKGHGPNNPGHP